MFRRSRAREVALQLLFERDLNKKPMPARVVATFASNRLSADKESIAFCLGLFGGVNQHREPIDAMITTTAENWRISRMMPSDRNVLRLAVYELLHAAASEPVPVVLNEAIELARRFGTADSSAFVNGILDKISKKREMDLPATAVTAKRPDAISGENTG
jgi:transcription antitermination protein NusB